MFLHAYTKAEKFFPVDKSTVEGYVNFLVLHSPAPRKGTLIFRACDATLLLEGAEGW